MGTQIYISGAPCPMCMTAIYWARIDKVYFANDLEDAPDRLRRCVPVRGLRADERAPDQDRAVPARPSATRRTRRGRRIPTSTRTSPVVTQSLSNAASSEKNSAAPGGGSATVCSWACIPRSCCSRWPSPSCGRRGALGEPVARQRPLGQPPHLGRDAHRHHGPSVLAGRAPTRSCSRRHDRSDGVDRFLTRSPRSCSGS